MCDDIKGYRRRAIAEMNSLRAKHNAPPLIENETINCYAQEWANKLANSGTLMHRQSRQYGENLFMGSGNTYEGAVRMWYNEVDDYDFNSPGFYSSTGHFTQLVWKSSREVGLGIAQGYNGMTVVVANFSPHGNVIDQFEENVDPRSY